MPMPAQMFVNARDLVAATPTDDLGRFARPLNDSGLEAVHIAGGGIEWWTLSNDQRNQLLAVVRAGSKQTECKNLLWDYSVRAPIGFDTVQSFVTGEFDRSGWFQYYYTEAAAVKSTLPKPLQSSLETITNAFFYKKSKSGPSGTIGMKISFDSVPDDIFRAILFELMTAGFERIPATGQQAIAGSASDAAIIGKLLWAGDAAEVRGTPIKVIKVKAKWRADSRKYADIKAASGFLTKAHSEGYARSKNLSAPWHPMSTEFGKRWLWFRKSQKDNCLYSVVSVGKAGKEWKTYLPYPLIKLSGGKVSGLSGYLGTKKVKCVPAKGGAPVELDLPVSETYLYLFVLAGLAVDTGAMQGDSNYPEVGVRGIPFKNVYGAVRFRRYHLGDPESVDDSAGVACVPVGSDRNDENHLTIKASYGQELFEKMGARFNEAARLVSPVAVKWSPSGDGFVELQPFAHEFTYRGAKYKLASPFTAR